MAINNYEIARGDYLSPTQYYETENRNSVSSDTAQRYLMAVRDIVNECIEKRIRDGQDIAKVYNAEIVDKVIDNENEVSSITVNNQVYKIYIPVVTSIQVKYNDNNYADISNDTVRILDNATLGSRNKWCKICTYDGVQFYVLHRL